MKKITTVTLLTILFAASVLAISAKDFENIVFSGNRGTALQNGPTEYISYNIGKGWNLVPLEFLMDASGRYNSFFKEGKSCDQDIFQNVWYYSPVQSKYYSIPRMDDWGAPKQMGNSFLRDEFKGKYYHIYGGSAWVYSPFNCVLEGDHAGIQLITEGAYNGGELEPEKWYSYKELVLKSGWNFVPIEMRMVAYEKSLKELFWQCGAQKFYKYDKANNKWLDISSEIDNKLNPEDIYETILVKTTRDCNFADFSAASSSAPPSIPSEQPCSDSDNGKDYNVKGVTSGIEWGTSGYTTKSDYCITSGPKIGKLAEYYCQEDDGETKVTSVSYECLNGCGEGRCI